MSHGTGATAHYSARTVFGVPASSFASGPSTTTTAQQQGADDEVSSARPAKRPHVAPAAVSSFLACMEAEEAAQAETEAESAEAAEVEQPLLGGGLPPSSPEQWLQQGHTWLVEEVEHIQFLLPSRDDGAQLVGDCSIDDDGGDVEAGQAGTFDDARILGTPVGGHMLPRLLMEPLPDVHAGYVQPPVRVPPPAAAAHSLWASRAACMRPRARGARTRPSCPARTGWRSRRRRARRRGWVREATQA